MQEKVILVTGGARRVGAAIVRAIHAQGARVMIHYHQSAREAEALRDELNASRPHSAQMVQADLLQTQHLSLLIDQTLKSFGQLDALVNNASSFSATPIGAITDENWHDLIGTNVKAPLFLSQAAAPALKKTKGCIINITDIHAERPLKNYVAYSVAKAALAALTRSLSIELGPDVRVNAVAPGVAIWPEQDGHFDRAEQARIIEHSSLKRAGTPEDIASAVKFLIVDATYMTGQVINVDGGRSVNI